MPRDYSLTARRRLSETSAAELPLFLLEISHADLPEPVRVVGDSQDLISNGMTYVGMGFRITLPDERQGQQPRAELSVDNVGRELMQWVEGSAGGRGARVRIMQVLRSAPNIVEWEIEMDLSNIRANAREVTGELGFPHLLDMPAVQVRADSTVMPGIF